MQSCTELNWIELYRDRFFEYILSLLIHPSDCWRKLVVFHLVSFQVPVPILVPVRFHFRYRWIQSVCYSVYLPVYLSVHSPVHSPVYLTLRLICQHLDFLHKLYGDIDISDGCWRRNLFVTTLRCW